MAGRTRLRIMEIVAVASAGLLLAGLGPYGTFAYPLPERIAYWVGVLLLAYVVYWPACLWADRLALRHALPRVGAWTAAILVATMPVSLIVWLASFRHTPQLWPDLALLAGFYPSVLVVGAGMTALLWLLERRSPIVEALVVEEPHSTGADLAAARFYARLPHLLGRDLLALEMEDHYVRAHTSAGSTLMLMRMRDAIVELEGVDGRQVHRSWWVARNAVIRAEPAGRAWKLTLSNGLVVPVPRERAGELKAAGWLATSRDGAEAR
jgi:hypothetical protein